MDRWKLHRDGADTPGPTPRVKAVAADVRPGRKGLLAHGHTATNIGDAMLTAVVVTLRD